MASPLPLRVSRIPIKTVGQLLVKIFQGDQSPHRVNTTKNPSEASIPANAACLHLRGFNLRPSRSVHLNCLLPATLRLQVPGYLVQHSQKLAFAKPYSIEGLKQADQQLNL
jgi:hypothetical protein